MKALVGAFNQETAPVGAFSVIVQPVVEPMDRFSALPGRVRRGAARARAAAQPAEEGHGCGAARGGLPARPGAAGGGRAAGARPRARVRGGPDQEVPPLPRQAQAGGQILLISRNYTSRVSR